MTNSNSLCMSLPLFANTSTKTWQSQCERQRHQMRSTQRVNTFFGGAGSTRIARLRIEQKGSGGIPQNCNQRSRNANNFVNRTANAPHVKTSNNDWTKSDPASRSWPPSKNSYEGTNRTTPMKTKIPSCRNIGRRAGSSVINLPPHAQMPTKGVLRRQ